MVRIVKPESHLTAKMKTIFDLLGVAIANDPLAIKSLLQKFGITTAEKPSAKELTDKVMAAIEKGNQKFAVALAKLLAGQVIPEGFDHFAGLGGGDMGGGGITVGSDPISAIAGAIGSVANLFGNAQKKKLMKQQASSQTMSTLLAYKAQKEKEVADAAAASQAQAKQMAMIKTIGLLAIATLVGWFFLRSFNKQTY